MSDDRTLLVRGDPLSISQVYAAALGQVRVKPSREAAVLDRMKASVDLVDQAVTEHWQVYGVTTGFGSMSDVAVPAELASASQNNLLSFLATSIGTPVNKLHVRAAMLLRANVLMQGLSGVRFEIVERLCQFLEAGATPVVRDLGSIGASGDLVPLAGLARAITGHDRTVDVELCGERQTARQVLQQLGLEPFTLRAKEGLAIVNGTSFSAAIAANCVARTRQLLAVSLVCQAMMLRALCVQEEAFHPFVHECKPHPGQVWTARAMRWLLADGLREKPLTSDHVQDRYSLRCLPQYLGPLVERLEHVVRTVELEMNSVSDNPLVDADQQRFFQGGNFLGQSVALAMDDVRCCLGLIAKHLDVQIAQLVSPEFSRGLPPSLRGNDGLAYNMGLKGLQITGNSIAPLLAHYGQPLVTHFPTHAEQFNQNVNGLSWGAANLAWKSVELYQHYVCVAVVFAVQAIQLRTKLTHGHYDGRVWLGTQLDRMYAAVYSVLQLDIERNRPIVFNDADQALEEYLQNLFKDLSEGGEVVCAANPILRSLDEANLAC